MNDFVTEFSALVASKPFGNPHRFTKAAKATGSQVGNTLKGVGLPKVEKLVSWLKKARVPKPTSDRLVFLLKLEMLRRDKDLGPMFDDFIRERKRLLAYMDLLIQAFRDLGHEPSHELLEGLRMLKVSHEW